MSYTNYFLAVAIASVISYVIGSLNSAIISVYLIKREDIRKFGSNNAGLTNVYRCFGPGCAGVTLILDLAKGLIVVLGTMLVLFSSGMFDADEHNAATACLIVSFFAVLGHVFPAFYGFKGGKGILVAATCALAVNPWIFVFGVITMLLFVGITKYISVGSIACCLGYPAFIFLSELLRDGITNDTYIHAAIAGAIGLLCLARHIPNIKRLINHTENKFSLSRK